MKRVFAFALTLALAAALTAPALAAEFTDVPASHTFHDAIAACSASGIVGGYSDGTFRPTNTLSKNHFCAMLARAFYPDRIKEFDTDYYKNTFGPFSPTNLALVYNGTVNGALENTSFRWYYDDSSVMSSGINRYDMAQLLSNIMKSKGVSVSDAEKSAAASRISDYSSIPADYRDAVASAAAKGLIGGYSDGSFHGDRTMNRGQAAVVIYRLQALVPAQSGTPVKTPDPAPAQTPAAGTLTNGKPITVANVLEILDQLKAQYPTGTDFAKGYGGLGSGRAPSKNCIDQIVKQYEYGGNGYSASGERVRTKGGKVSTTGGCGGWAAFVEDSIFGQNATFRKTNFDQVRPGDLLIKMDSEGYLMHVSVVQSELFPDTHHTIYYGEGHNEPVSDEDYDHYVTWCYNTTDAAADRTGHYNLFWDGVCAWTIDDRNPSVIFGTSGGNYDYYTAYPD